MFCVPDGRQALAVECRDFTTLESEKNVPSNEVALRAVRRCLQFMSWEVLTRKAQNILAWESNLISGSRLDEVFARSGHSLPLPASAFHRRSGGLLVLRNAHRLSQLSKLRTSRRVWIRTSDDGEQCLLFDDSKLCDPTHGHRFRAPIRSAETISVQGLLSGQQGLLNGRENFRHHFYRLHFSLRRFQSLHGRSVVIR